MESLLAMDLALKTGIAAWKQGDSKPYASLLQIDASKDIGGRLAQIPKWLIPFIQARQITDICVEAPITTAGSAEKIFWLVSAYGVVCMVASQCKVRVTPIANATMAIHWIGSNSIERAQRKMYSILEAQRRGFPNVKDDNIADALGLLSLRCSMLGLTPPWDYKRSPGPLFTGVAAPAGVKITKANKIAANVAVNKLLSFEREKPS